MHFERRLYLWLAWKLWLEKSQRKKKWHLIKAVELFRRFNCNQIPHTDFGSGAHKSIDILRCPTHRKRVLNGRHQNFIYIGQCGPKLYAHCRSAARNFIYIGRSPQKIYIHWAISEPQWLCERCLKKQHRKKKWHWYTAGVTEVKF